MQAIKKHVTFLLLLCLICVNVISPLQTLAANTTAESTLEYSTSDTKNTNESEQSIEVSSFNLKTEETTSEDVASDTETSTLTFSDYDPALSPGRELITGEEVGSAIVTNDVTFDENNEIVLSEDIDLASIPMPMATVGESCLITPHATTLWYGNWSTCKFTIGTSTGNHMGYCAQPQTPTPSGYYTVSKLDCSTEKGKKIKIALMFGENGPWYSESVNLFGGCSWSSVYAYLHAMIGIVYSGQTIGLTATQVQAMNGAINQQYLERGNLAILNNYTVYVAYNNKQDIVWLEKVPDTPPTGKITLKKVSSKPELTDGESYYSLKGAQYGVYSDSACTTKVSTLTTDAAGNSNTISITANKTYYIKEITAPAGFELDTKIYSAWITVDKTVTLNVSEKPKEGYLILKKTSVNPELTESNTNYTLAGAVYGIYKEVGCTTLIDKLTTNAQGSSNTITLVPNKTYYIKEIEAPKGFKKDTKTYNTWITANKTVTLNVQEYPYVFEVKIIKKLKDSDIIIPGTVFKHTLPDGSFEEVTTDQNGEALLKGLTYGTHNLEEISVPEGYTKNPGKVTFEVTTNNEIKLTSNTATAESGQITFTAKEDGNALLNVEDTLQPYSLLLHKTNEDNKVLKGAEFTLYEDANCTKVLKTGITDENGTLTFSDLSVGTKYYLKETKAPKGYPIPVDSDGKDMVYEIYTESNPLNDIFNCFVNEKEHTKDNGTSAITGSKTDRIVNLTIINQTGIKMPNTGTHATMILFLIGLVCMSTVILYELKNRKKH